METPTKEELMREESWDPRDDWGEDYEEELFFSKKQRREFRFRDGIMSEPPPVENHDWEEGMEWGANYPSDSDDYVEDEEYRYATTETARPVVKPAVVKVENKQFVKIVRFPPPIPKKPRPTELQKLQVELESLVKRVSKATLEASEPSFSEDKEKIEPLNRSGSLPEHSCRPTTPVCMNGKNQNQSSKLVAPSEQSVEPLALSEPPLTKRQRKRHKKKLVESPDSIIGKRQDEMKKPSKLPCTANALEESPATNRMKKHSGVCDGKSLQTIPKPKNPMASMKEL
jgi:hypothetical protein